MMLRDHAFARQLNSQHAETLDRCAQECTVAAGGYLWKQGDVSDVLYLICSGKVALEISVPNRGPIQIESVEKDEILGGSWLLPLSHWSFDARALTEVAAFRLDGTRLRQICEYDTVLGYHVLKAFAVATAQRLQLVRLRLLDFFGPGAQ